MKRDKYICQNCLLTSKVRVATEVHHTVKIRRDPSKRLDIDTLIAVCRECHELLEPTA
jgi:5-methylcytosine-specific restriction endonuclease McrA